MSAFYAIVSGLAHCPNWHGQFSVHLPEAVLGLTPSLVPLGVSSSMLDSFYKHSLSTFC